MAEGDLISTLVTHTFALLTGGGLSTFLVNQHFTKKERKRQESEEARKLVIRLLPALQIAQRQYTRFLNESIYLHDIDNEIRNSQISTIVICKPDADLAAIIDSAALHLLENRFLVELAGHKARMLSLASELDEKQSSLNYDYAFPEDLAVAAKDHLDRNFVDLILALHQLRRDMTVTYLGKSAWPASEKRLGAELAKLRKRVYSETSWGDQFGKFKNRLEHTYSKYLYRFRRWLRDFGMTK
ncbi:hypothetical protein [Methylobacterium tarhaniae]|uniref:hypothetical protein n=1 Tax=Methylobacterium tarhaniae TaxID=1187852 RepID=UPI0012EEC1CE|nr:hypothetical protein [Methylobacterium tarhaniae]